MARRQRSAVFIGGDGFRNIQGGKGLQAMIAALDPALVQELAPVPVKAADRMVREVRRRAPVSDLEVRAGDLRDSVHREPGAHPLAARVVEDARDAKGRFIPKHVEHGHLAPDGSHVAAQPHFWPGYRKVKGGIRREGASAVKRAVAKVKSKGKS